MERTFSTISIPKTVLIRLQALAKNRDQLVGRMTARILTDYLDRQKENQHTETDRTENEQRTQ